LLVHTNNFITAYGHASEILVKRCDNVNRGDVIAKAGQTGSVSFPQLHFEVRRQSVPIDPVLVLNSSKSSGDNPVRERARSSLPACSLLPPELTGKGPSGLSAPEPKASGPAAITPATAPGRIQAVQRALTDFGYGPLKITGVFDADTRLAIAKFARERRLSVSGELDNRLIRELSIVTGRALN
jgi:hypothetical protein